MDSASKPAAVTLHNGLPRFTFLNASGAEVANTATDLHCFQDAKTGLVWGLTSAKELTAKQADKLEAESQLLGEAARQPTLDELETLRDITRHNPATFPELIPLMKSDWYRTSSAVSGYSDCRWGVYFSYGDAYFIRVDGDAWVRLVRGPVAALPRQSSDL